jgi:F0F1-type ATP synthase epsilon subunit
MVITTPHAVILDAQIRGARVPTETGLVGLRPRVEPLLLVIEPGLVVLREDGARRYAATAGGLFEASGTKGVLYTPFGVVGPSAEEVLAALDRELATPDSELALRRQLGDLEKRIVQRLREKTPVRAR